MGQVILLDTNVVSELMRPVPNGAVLQWLDAQPPQDLATSTVTVAEIGAGLAVMPSGARQTDLRSRAAQLLAQGFAERIFGFDLAAAAVYSDLFALRRRSGRPPSGYDLLIAAIAHARGMAVATRNTSDFAGCGLRMVNPWEGLTAGEKGEKGLESE